MSLLAIDAGQRKPRRAVTREKLRCALERRDGFRALQTAAQPVVRRGERAVNGDERFVFTAGIGGLAGGVQRIGQSQANRGVITEFQRGAQRRNGVGIAAIGGERGAQIVGVDGA